MGNNTLELEWVKKAKDKDNDAMEKLYLSCYTRVYHTIRSIIGNDEETVKDLLQDTFIKAFTSLEQLKDDSKFPAWIAAIARNKAIDICRQRARQQLVSVDEVDEDGLAKVQLENRQPDTMPQMQLDKKEDLQLLWEIIDKLPAGQRLALTLRYGEGLSISEIARSLRLSEGTIKAQLYTGRKNIEKTVREMQEQKGTKLYGMLPFPFFLTLLRSQNTVEIEPDRTLLEYILQRSGIQTAASSVGAQSAQQTQTAAHTASASTIKTTGAAAGSAAVKGKTIAGIVAAALIGIGGIAAGTQYMELHKQPEPSQETTQSQPETSQEKTPDSTAEPSHADGETTEAKSYGTLLRELQDDGVFLQYAHMEDLNGDGTEELILLHDNTALTIYQIEQGKPEAVYETHADYGFMCYEEEVLDQTYEEAYNSMGGQTAVAELAYDASQHKLRISPLNENWRDDMTYTVVDCSTWKEELGADAETDGYRNISADGDSAQQIFSDQLSYLLGKSDDMTAYKRFLRQERMISEAGACYEYIYLDDDDVPELVISDSSASSGQVTVYDCKDGLVRRVQDQLGSNGDVFYQEREGKLLSKVNKDSGEAVLYDYRDGVLTPSHTSTFSMDMEGNMHYEIDGKSVSEEEGDAFWDMDGTEYLTAGQDGENAVQFQTDDIG